MQANPLFVELYLGEHAPRPPEYGRFFADFDVFENFLIWREAYGKSRFARKEETFK